MRLVSQGVRQAMQTAVQGFTLTLGAEPANGLCTTVLVANSAPLVKFLRSSQLLCLRVTVPTLGNATGESLLIV